MRGNVAGVTWPHISLGVAGAVAALVRQLERTQWLPADELARRQLQQVGVLARQLAGTAPQFGQRLAAAGLEPDDLAAPEGFGALAPLQRHHLQDAGESLFATEVPPDHGAVSELKSSGSTGEPVVVRRTELDGVAWSALTLRDHLWRGLDFRGRISTSRFKIDDLTELPNWGRPVALLFESGPAQAIPLRFSVEKLAEHVAAFSPHVLQVYPSVLGPLVRHCTEHDVELPDLRFVHTVGESLPPETRAAAVERFGATVWDTYSCEEVGTIAFDCPEGDDYHVMSEALVVEVLDEQGRPCAEGETGRVVVTDLHNAATPLVRYDLGDHAEVGGPCPCGRGLPTLRRILGRSRNLVVLPDGSRHWPVVGFYRYRDIAPIRQYQLVQRRRDTIDVHMVVDAPVTAEQEAALTEVIRDALGHPFALEFTWHDEPLPRQAGGKFEDFRCEL